jgi:hypothetical protein
MTKPKDIFEQLNAVITIPDGLDPKSLNGALALAERFWPDMVYAQNGGQFEIRWSPSDPPFGVPTSGVPARIARKIVDSPNLWEKQASLKEEEAPPEKEEPPKKKPAAKKDEAPPKDDQSEGTEEEAAPEE